jgi:1-acyl-sn-glycerol-3-phosphate acyltransferase
VRRALVTLLEGLFRLLFTYDCAGQDKIPAEGPAVVAANHSSYLDPVLLSLEIERPIHFMAWDALFKVPILGYLIRVLGAFPVDVSAGKGRQAYEKAKALVEAGEIVGIFPEGKRSHAGWMEPSLREGAARLALETGAPLVPATIAGAFRAWPYFHSLPKPSRIKVRFHDPIDPIPYRALPKGEALAALLAELKRRVERSLVPGVKADLRMSVLYGLPAPWPRLYESLPPLAAALFVFWKTRSFLTVAPAYGYIVYLLLDHFVIPQSRLVKWLRNSSPVLFLLAFSPVVVRSQGLPPVPAGEALAALMVGALFPYLYEHGRTALGFIRGLVSAICIEVGAYALVPVGFGPHIALPVFAAAFAWERRTVSWRYTASVLACYAFVSWRLMGGGPGAIPHAIAGLVAWMLSSLFPYRSESEHPERHTLEGLGLRDPE